VVREDALPVALQVREARSSAEVVPDLPVPAVRAVVVDDEAPDPGGLAHPVALHFLDQRLARRQIEVDARPRECDPREGRVRVPAVDEREAAGRIEQPSIHRVVAARELEEHDEVRPVAARLEPLAIRLLASAPMW
jgi:hypothetical protein